MDKGTLVGRIVPAVLLAGLLGCPGVEKEALPLPIRQRPSYVREYTTRTKDGWEIALHRYPPKSPLEGHAPVLLCHGIGYNSRFWSLDEEHDFASYLREAGFDTWAIDLRGGGQSTKPVWHFLRLPEMNPAEIAKANVRKQDWSAEDYIRYDVPAAIDFVCKETGHNQVAWVGHSLGGMILMGYLERFGGDKILCFAAIASPMIIPRPPNNILRDIPGFRLLMKMVNNRWQALAGAATLSQVKSPIDTLFYNADNVDSVTVLSLFLHATEDVPSGLIEQTLVLAQTGEFVSHDGKFNYAAQLSRIHTPALLVAGKADNMADPEGIRDVYHRIASQDKTFRLFGRANGDSIDYGHNDLIIGKKAPQEVFPFILEWLNQRAKAPEKCPPK